MNARKQKEATAPAAPAAPGDTVAHAAPDLASSSTEPNTLASAAVVGRPSALPDGAGATASPGDDAVATTPAAAGLAADPAAATAAAATAAAAAAAAVAVATAAAAAGAGASGAAGGSSGGEAGSTMAASSGGVADAQRQRSGSARWSGQEEARLQELVERQEGGSSNWQAAPTAPRVSGPLPPAVGALPRCALRRLRPTSGVERPPARSSTMPPWPSARAALARRWNRWPWTTARAKRTRCARAATGTWGGAGLVRASRASSERGTRRAPSRTCRRVETLLSPHPPLLRLPTPATLEKLGRASSRWIWDRSTLCQSPSIVRPSRPPRSGRHERLPSRRPALPGRVGIWQRRRPTRRHQRRSPRRALRPQPSQQPRRPKPRRRPVSAHNRSRWVSGWRGGRREESARQTAPPCRAEGEAPRGGRETGTATVSQSGANLAS